MKKYVLHMDNPAYEWENATPVGNGSMGAMLYGTVKSERLQLNEEAIWAGQESGVDKIPQYKVLLDHINQLLLDGKGHEADVWAKENLGGFGRVRSYEYAGALYVDFHDTDDCENYVRDLDLNRGVAKVTYEKDGASFTRECFASHPAKLIVYKAAASVKTDASVRFEREIIESIAAENGIFRAVCKTAAGDNHFCMTVKPETDGKITCADGVLTVSAFTSLVLYISIVSDHKSNDICGDCDRILKAASGYDAILSAHVDDFTAIMERSDIDLGCDCDVEKLTIKDRLARLRADENLRDFGLLSLYFQFGKYLLISSSRYDTLPANLQGVWAEKLSNPWGADYHTNINLQMNYWHAEVANISECTNALFTYMNDYLLESGKKTAEITYQCRGTVVHHLSDLYKFTLPADGLWGLWPLGAAWLCYHMWEHYLYTKDEAFLKNVAYDYIKESALFFIDYMFEDKNGQLLSGPSTSPENTYLQTADGETKSVSLCLSPTMDIEIIGGLLKFYAETEKILNINPALAAEAETALSKMPPLAIGKHGQLMEWLEDYDEAEPGHRHISHAFDLYPGCGINRNTPDLFKAIEVTLDRRLSHGGGHTGWSRAWLINLFSRLGKGEKAYENAVKLLTKSTKDNLFDSHPPFQIDGNFGGAAGIAEMLLQSHETIDGLPLIRILPAIPECCSSGSFDRLCARGNYEVSAKWQSGKVTEVKIKGKTPGNIMLELPGKKPEKVTVEA